jgi:hypothetical protein
VNLTSHTPITHIFSTIPSTSLNLYTHTCACIHSRSDIHTNIPAHVQHKITFTVQSCTVVPKTMSTSCPLVYTIVTSQCVDTKLDSLDTVVFVFCTFIYVWNKQQNATMQFTPANLKMYFILELKKKKAKFIGLHLSVFVYCIKR